MKLLLFSLLSFVNAYATGPFDVVGVGQSCVDLLIEGHAELMPKHDAPEAGVRFVTLDELGALLRDLPAPEYVPGGPAANLVADVAALGGTAGHFGKVGRDEAGRVFLDDFAKRGVRACCPPAKDGATSVCALFLRDGHQSGLLYMGCAEEIESSDFDRFDFGSSAAFVVEGHLLTNPRTGDVIRHALARARVRTQVVLNLQGIFGWDEAVRDFVVGHVDLVVGNEYEHGFWNDGRVDRIVTRDARGASYLDRHGSALHAPAVEVRDFVSPVGAGDAFVAGLLVARARGWSWDRALAFANAQSARAVGQLSARLPMPIDTK